MPITTSTSLSSPAAATDPRPPGPEGAGRVRLVDRQQAAVSPGQLDQAGERRDVAVHREHPVGDDQPRPVAGVAQAGLEVLEVAVAVDVGSARESRQPSMMLAWLSSSEKITSPSPASAAIVPVLAR